VIGIDNVNDYYSIKLKNDRLNNLKKFKFFKFYKFDLRDTKKLDSVFKKHKFDAIYHFAAQAGVRYSVEKPRKYIESNIDGFFNLLEKVREKKIKKLFFASSSSVYGDSKKFPLSEKDSLQPNNTYSLSKKFNEDLAKIYNKFYKVNSVALRFFTVYGEWGRPDMFYSKVLDAGFRRSVLYINNFGNHSRDFTYIKDVNLVLYNLLSCKTISSFDILNVCSNRPWNIIKLVKFIEKFTGKISIYKREIQQADVMKTHGNNKKIKTNKLIQKFTPIEIGIKNTLDWYKKYNNF
jgi:UDP-glucuronate 4-epimerase